MPKTKRPPPESGITFFRDAAAGCEVVLAAGDAIAYPAHCHMESVVVGLVRSGRVRLARCGRSDFLGAGEVFAVPTHQAHSLSATGPYGVVNLCLDAAKLNAGSVRSAGRAIGGLVRQGVLSGDECARLTAALQAVLQTRRGQRAEERRAAADDPLGALRSRLAADPGLFPSLTDMAGAVHICPRHFARTFHARYGLPPLRYQRQSRLRRARLELAAGGRSLAQTACGAGFFDQSHFIREFRKLYRMTPGEYQRAQRELSVSKARA